jgi:hypothetical protein
MSDGWLAAVWSFILCGDNKGKMQLKTSQAITGKIVYRPAMEVSANPVYQSCFFGCYGRVRLCTTPTLPKTALPTVDPLIRYDSNICAPRITSLKPSIQSRTRYFQPPFYRSTVSALRHLPQLPIAGILVIMYIDRTREWNKILKG